MLVGLSVACSRCSGVVATTVVWTIAMSAFNKFPSRFGEVAP